MAMAAISSSIMEAIGGNPFSTPIGHRIEQATDANLATEDWGAYMEICDLINESEDGPRDAIRAIRKRLQQAVGKNFTPVIYALTLLETCVKNCGHRFHVLACTRDSIQDLVKLIGPKYDPPQVVQEKVLGLIQCWAEAFRTNPDLQGVVQVYNELRSKGVQFPPTDLDSMAPIQTPPRSVSEIVKQPTEPVSPRRAATQAQPAAPVSLRLTPDQLGKLRSELDVVETNVKVMSEMLNELTPGEEHPEDAQLLQDLNETCRAMQQRVVALISQISNDDLTADLLKINDDLNGVFLRYGKYQRARNAKDKKSSEEETQKSPSKPAQPSLIDFEDEKGVAAGVGAMSLDRPTGPEVDSEFDMFAQSRSASSKNPGTTYEDNINIDTAPGSLGETAQTRLLPRADEAVLNSQLQKESDFEEMESWLKTQPGHREGMTSSEFDQFLAERAAAAGRVPPASRPKDKDDDPMFGL